MATKRVVAVFTNPSVNPDRTSQGTAQGVDQTSQMIALPLITIVVGCVNLLRLPARKNALAHVS